MKREVREESIIFSELAELCSPPGYVHAIAYLCFRDNTIKYSDTVETEDVLQQFSMERLVRTEVSTLIGLVCKNRINTDLPSSEKIQEYIEKTDTFLKEIHQSIMPDPSTIFESKRIGDETFNPFTNGSVLREPIFYGGEAAYNFQYRDLSATKYKKDNDWFIKNKGFSVSQGIEVITAIQTIQIDKINGVLQGLIDINPIKWTIFSAYIFNVGEVVALTNIDNKIVQSVVNSFVSAIGLDSFKALDDFNPTNAFPIIGLEDNQYLLFQNYSLVEALYETPFFWFNEDKGYTPKAMKHRGEFTEDFSAERLVLVFGKNRVFTNIDIYDSKKTRVGEIDVLVIFANRAIILQAKSKKLTINARKGNDNSLQRDFKKAIQSAYNQAHSCAGFLNDIKYSLVTTDGHELDINRSFQEIYPFCVVSDHYPALSFQARQFLKFTENSLIKPPFVMDVFLLDVMTEMLQSPLQFLSYINRRTTYGDKILSTHELTILSYHLKQNLWMDSEYSMMHLGDDICADLDLAMFARREGMPGKKTPDGILTKYSGTNFHKILSDIESIENAATIDLGFMLLSLSGETIEMFNDGISHLAALGLKDGKHHDLTLGISDGESGITIHCNNDPVNIAGPRLKKHCEHRKYSYKAKTWFGLCLGVNNNDLKCGITLDHSWVQSDKMDKVVIDLPKGQNLKGKSSINFKTLTRNTQKIGRNEKCSCGSGKKRKKCCLN